MNGLTESVSNLSLDQSSGKKNKRPFRAFHNFSNTTQANVPGGPGGGSATYPVAATRFETSGVNMGKNVLETEKYSVNTVGQTLPPAPTSHLVPTQRIEDQQQMLSKTFVPAMESQPPLATTQFYSARQSVCDPRLMSLSMCRIPTTEQLRAATKLPVSLAVHPFAKEVVLDGEIQVVDASTEDGPLRCRRCRSYVNPKYVFTHDYKAICNMCQIKTQVPHQRYGPLSMGGPELGIPEDPERNNGTVEFVVPELYNTKQGRPTVPLHYVFLVDVSFWANENKSSLASIEGVRTAINYIAESQPNCKIAIIAYDKWLRFFNLRPESPHAQELIVSEVKEIFLPLYSGLFVRPEESMHVIQDTLSKLEAYIQDDKYSHKAESCLGSALEAALLALDTVTNGNGGKIIASMNTMPTIGGGNLSIKKDDGMKKNLKCENDYYIKLAQNMLKSYVSVDLFCTGSMFLDLATLGHVSMITSGVVKHYPNFHINKDEFTVVNDMLHSVASTVGYQAQLKVRCSSGLSVSNYHTMACGNSDRDPVIPVLNCDQSITVHFKYDDKLKPGSEVSFQAALLYTDLGGVRKVRSINLNAITTTQIEEMFRYANQDVIASTIIKEALFDINEGNFVHVRKSVENKVIGILTQYRALVDGMHGSQLIIPDSLKALPAYLLSFQKTELFRNNTHSSRGNERLIDYFKYHTYNLHQLSYKLYPQIFPLHEPLADEDYTFYDENNLLLQLDSTDALAVTNSHSSLISGGCYLICHGDVIYLWFNEHTNVNLLSDLLTGSDPGSLHYASISLFGAQLPEVDTDINFRARNIIQYWSQILNCSYIPVLPLRPNVDQYYSSVMSSIMCEDKSIEMIEAYNNYLVALHRSIKDNIEQDHYVKPGTSAKNDGDNLSSFIQF